MNNLAVLDTGFLISLFVPYCDRLFADKKISFRVVSLSDGFDESKVNEDGQKPLELPERRSDTES